MIRQVNAKSIDVSGIMTNKASRAVYQGYLPQALAEGWHRPAPQPEVIGKGRGHMKKAVGLNQKRVSAKKIAISIPFLSIKTNVKSGAQNILAFPLPLSRSLIARAGDGLKPQSQPGPCP